jgi:hypothetical protein
MNAVRAATNRVTGSSGTALVTDKRHALLDEDASVPAILPTEVIGLDARVVQRTGLRSSRFAARSVSAPVTQPSPDRPPGDNLYRIKAETTAPMFK